MKKATVRSTCQMCSQGCGVIIHLENERPVRITGDPNDPVNQGLICPKGAAAIEYLHHPLRLRYPIQRIGQRGEGKWRRISWDEALNNIATKLTQIKEKYGPHSIAFICGGAKGYQDSYIARFANVFGSPNLASMASQCYFCRVIASRFTYGFMTHPDYDSSPALILMWALNPRNTAQGDWKRIKDALNKGSKLVVIDPWKSELTQMAHIWVKPRSGTDLAIALGMINVIINEELYDKTFVEKWTVGFDKLKTHIQDYPPEKVSEITWVPAEIIKQIARLYAMEKPACLPWGNGIENSTNNFQCCRALAILRAITGNIGIPGGDIEFGPSGLLPKFSPLLTQHNLLSDDIRARRISSREGSRLLMRYALPQTLIKAVLTGRPYPIKAFFIQGASLLHSYPNSQETYQAMRKLEFSVATDFFITPSAELTDVVLPVATYLELDGLYESEYLHTASIIQKVAESFDCRSDYQIYTGLAKLMGLDKYFWNEEKDMLDFILTPTGLTFNEFRNINRISGGKRYWQYEKVGFITPSKKVEIYSDRLAKLGFDPLPVYREPPESPFSDPELAEEYPLVMTNHKVATFQNSRERMIKTLRQSYPEPLVYIQTKTAENLNIADGDKVFIENKRGRIKQTAALLDDIDPRVIIVDFGWWYPEKDIKDLHGWAESNVNILTSNKPPFAPELGSATLGGILCKIYKET